MAIHEISKSRFDAFIAHSRHPMAKLASKELAWYVDSNDKVLGVVDFDLTDKDFGYIVLGRDKNRRFRRIDDNVSIRTFDEAFYLMEQAMNSLATSESPIFPQGNEMQRTFDIFNAVVPREKFHKSFQLLLEQEGFSPARGIMQEIGYHFKDPDGNFIQQFQTDGFDARLWEFYLFAFLAEAGFLIERSHSSPDFIVTNGVEKICLEAVTVNPTSNRGNASQSSQQQQQDDTSKLQHDYFSIKFGSPLFSKLEKRYWELPHATGKPLIFAIDDFQETGSMGYTASSLPVYLYGSRATWKYDQSGQLHITEHPVDSHCYKEKTIPSGFFFQPKTENVSAVLFSNSGTLSKFNRMGYIAGFGSRRVKMIRQGWCHDFNPNVAEPKQFTLEVHEPGYHETWGEGLSIFHNPRATHPVSRQSFPGIAQHFFKDGRLTSYLPEFHPYSSNTIILQCI